MRAETGCMKFGDDWRGLFIRGDNAWHYAEHLRKVLPLADPFARAVLTGLLQELFNTNERMDQVDVQLMKPFEECTK